jgi:5-enolpyruvylshikimate-3-phosphate synthase
MSPPLAIHPITRPTTATITLPGSKSITNRALILAALSDGPVTLEGALFSRDTRIMATALTTLGFEVAANEDARTISVRGLGGEIPVARATLDVGNAGTAARFLTALLALRRGGEYILDGDAAMRARPMSGLLRALAAQGATATAPDGGAAETFPFTLRTNGLRGGEIAVDAAASSQILSALLLVAPLADAPAIVRLAGETVSQPFVEMTLRMMADFGHGTTTSGAATAAGPSVFTFKNRAAYHAPTTRELAKWKVEGRSVGWMLDSDLDSNEPADADARAERYLIEPDATAASYFLALPLAAPVTVRLRGLRNDGLQGDAAFAEVLRRLGLPIRPIADGNGLESAPPQSHEPPAPAQALPLPCGSSASPASSVCAVHSAISPTQTPNGSAPAPTQAPPLPGGSSASPASAVCAVHSAIPPTPNGWIFDFNAISDTFLTLAALAPLLASPLTIRGVAHARRQETDRLLAVATELEKLGQRVAPSAAELRVNPDAGDITIYPDLAAMRRATETSPISIRTYEDHRIAMSFAILASHNLHGDGRPWLLIEDPACCAKTFPTFFAHLNHLHPA